MMDTSYMYYLIDLLHLYVYFYYRNLYRDIINGLYNSVYIWMEIIVFSLVDQPPFTIGSEWSGDTVNLSLYSPI